MYNSTYNMLYKQMRVCIYTRRGAPCFGTLSVSAGAALGGVGGWRAGLRCLGRRALQATAFCTPALSHREDLGVGLAGFL